MDLLGQLLVHRTAEGFRVARIVETEAYISGDQANHARIGPTVRNRAMFGPPGTLYVYRIHQVVCANLVTRAGQAVLLRAGAPILPPEANPSGPGRLCRVLGLTLADDGTTSSEGGRWELYAAEPRTARRQVVTGPRVGISRAVDRPLRFAIAGDPWVSRPRPPPT